MQIQSSQDQLRVALELVNLTYDIHRLISYISLDIFKNTKYKKGS